MKKNGFTLVETLISLTLILISLMFFLNLIIQAKSELKRSRTRLSLYQDYDNIVNKLLSLPFNSSPGIFPHQTTGITNLAEKLRVSCKTEQVSDSLMKIHLFLSAGPLKIKGYFYKSKYINGGKNE